MKFRRALVDSIYRYFPSIAAWVVALYGYCSRSSKSYSLYGEDILLKHVFQDEGAGVYVDIGAFHSRWISNTYLLAKKGWCGVVVDIDKNKLLTFGFRKQCNRIVAAVVPAGFSDDFVCVYKFMRANSEYDTLDRAQALEYSQRYSMKFNESLVKALPVDLLMIECFRKYSKVDYVNINIEGLDDLVLLSIDLSVYGVKLVQFENNNEFPGSVALRLHLEKCGYVHLATQGGTHSYIAKDILVKRFPLSTKIN